MRRCVTGVTCLESRTTKLKGSQKKMIFCDSQRLKINVSSDVVEM